MLHHLMALAPFAAALAVLYVALSINVVRMRYRYRQALGVPDGDDAQRAIRTHANFQEYAPFSLLLIALAAMLGAPVLLVKLLGLALFISRLTHAYSLLVAEPRYKTLRWRQIGMISGFTVLLVAAGALLWQWASYAL